MAKQRMTSNDYRIELKRLTDSIKSVENNITKRLIELCKQYPDVEIEHQVKSSHIINVQQFINEMYSIKRQLDYIQVIEKWLADQHSHKQTKMF